MKNMKIWITGFILVLSMFALSACGGSAAATDTPAAAADSGAGGQGQQGPPRFTSAYLNNTYDNALGVTQQLSLGTMKLEGTPNAVTAEQAAKLLLFWQSMQSGSIQNATEAGAVYKQIEATMTPAQMKAIVDMKLTRTDLQDWAKKAGIQLPQFFQGQGGTPSPADATRRAEFQNLSPEARQTRVAQFQSQGGGQGGQGGQRGQRRNVLLEPLVKLLTTRAAGK